jgi:hypothetical protein
LPAQDGIVKIVFAMRTAHGAFIAIPSLPSASFYFESTRHRQKNLDSGLRPLCPFSKTTRHVRTKII